MKMNFHDIAKKAHGGDKESMTLLIIEAPKGMQGERSPKEFAEQLSSDKGACGKMEDMDYTSKDVFDSYADDYSEEEPHDLQSDLQGLLDGWKERDPDTPAGKYYEDLKAILDRQFGTEEGGEE
tara:strand:+ start:912 stop:1283 length:372 start_codon:yes stop_codon:yes gene_type:complete